MFSSKDLFFTPAAGGYTVSKSLRFRSSATAYLNRTAGSSATNQNIGTWSFWLKRGTLGANQRIFEGYTASTDAGTSAIEFNSTDNIVFGGWTVNYRISTQVFRDPSAFYHFVVAIDTTQSTANNRVKIYVNGAEITAFSTTNNPTQNTTFGLNNNSSVLQIGRRRIVSNNDLFFDGYLAEVNFIDGAAKQPTDFGAYDTNGVWQPAAYTGTYGTNGYYLKFTDTTSTTTLVADSSGNGNNWTPNNISVTSGTTYDSMIDSPTNYADGGTGRGNYPVMNPLAPSSDSKTNGNLTVNTSTAAYPPNPATMAFQSGLWYWEVTVTTAPSANAADIGIIGVTNTSITNGIGGNTTGYSYYGNSGNKLNNSGTGVAYGATYTTGDVIGVAFDATNGNLWFAKNNTWQASGNPASGTNAAFTGISGSYYPAVAKFTSTAGGVMDVNFGQRPFNYTPPSGFSALNTQNLSTPTITNGAQYMAAVLYTGTGSSQTITASSTNSGNNPNGTTFQPDWVWVKGRSGATDHALYDAVRGVQLQLESNTTGVETTETTGLTAFTSSGFTTGALAQMNTNTATYVAWEWNAGGSNATNTSGSITSTVRANTSAGFSVATFTCPASGNFTVGHGLGVTPSMIIVKSRSTAGNNWCVVHSGMTNMAAYFMQLNTTIAQTNNTSIWANTAPTSTVFSMGTNVACSPSDTAVAYCFAPVAGYSAFGSYTGNGSTDGPFVYCGFRPRFVLVKNTSVAGDWYIFDTSRSSSNGANVEDYKLYPSAANAENGLAGETTSTNNMDTLSNGFKLRTTNGNTNGSTNVFIYAAFAENPFKISRAR